MIKHIEYQIVERGFEEGWIVPQPAKVRTGKRVAVIGSGPAGLAAAQNLARAGHDVMVIEKDERPGGLLRYGIPDFKLHKGVIDRRLDQMRPRACNSNAASQP
jgi:glutamate synthase (NADPH/NADH) small chain